MIRFYLERNNKLMFFKFKYLTAKDTKKTQSLQKGFELCVLGVSFAFSAFNFCILSLLLILTANLTFSADYKVSSLTEIKKTLKQIQPGDNIILANGNWTDAKIVFEAKGTPDKPITLRAATLGQVILNGTSSLKIAGEYLIVDGLYFKGGSSPDKAVIEFRKGPKILSTHCRLTNISIIDYNPPSNDTSYNWVSVYGTHNRIDHCYFRNKTNHGCLLVVWVNDKPNYTLIDSNYFAYRPELRRNGAETIRIGDSNSSMFNSNATVEYNYFEECNGEREIISNKSCFNTYRYNTFVACQGALTLRHGNNCTVEGNFFFGKAVPNTGGVRIIGENHKVINNYFADLRGDGAFSAISMMNGVPDSPLNRYFCVKNALVAFNTLVNNKSNIEIGVGANAELSLPPVDCIIANNIVLGKTSPLVKEISKPVNIKWQGNIFYGANLGIDNNKGIKLINPNLSLATDSLWRPTDASAAIGNAVGKYDFVTTDIDRQPRLEKKDVGCNQCSKSVMKIKPMKPVDVTPIWKK
jgi:poly(beta-D-mannuronate) lyase